MAAFGHNIYVQYLVDLCAASLFTVDWLPLVIIHHPTSDAGKSKASLVPAQIETNLIFLFKFQLNYRIFILYNVSFSSPLLIDIIEDENAIQNVDFD